MVKFFVGVMLMVAGVGMLAAEPQAKIDIDGKDAGIALTAGTKPDGGNIVLLDENAILCSESAQLTDSAWHEYSFSFTPDKDGTVSLVLEGGRTLGNNTDFWICFDQVEAIGAAVTNGDFETRDVTGRPVGWSIPDLSMYISFNGNYSVRVRYDRPTQQKIAVKAGKEVTIRAKVRKIKA